MAYPNSYQEIHIDDVSKWHNYQDAWKNDTFATGSDIIDDYSQYQKATQDMFNDICGDIETLEQNKSALTTIPQARYYNLLSEIRKLSDKGDYDSTIGYYKYNFVHYQNRVYMALQTVPNGTVPGTAPTYWLDLGLVGEDGALGININIKYAWSNTTQYAQYDVVTHDGVMWVAKQANIGSTPSAGSSDWEQLIDPDETQIYVSASEPTSPFIGQIWWDL